MTMDFSLGKVRCMQIGLAHRPVLGQVQISRAPGSGIRRFEPGCGLCRSGTTMSPFTACWPSQFPRTTAGHCLDIPGLLL